MKRGSGWPRENFPNRLLLFHEQRGTLALQHNRSHIYRKKVASGASLGDALQELARVGKQRCNPRITGFIKVVENTSFCFAAGGSYLPLATILEDQVCGKR